MTPPRPEWRVWLYGLAWLGGGVAAFGLAIWLIVLIRWDWPAATAAQRLDILGKGLFAALGIVALVAFGLTMRAAIRNFKLTGAMGSAEAHSSAEDDR
ncbi:hypothetical protein GV829_04690 [Sphingomonas lacunae]|uniref:Uncharacterized protein n=1 Tax=Sphingomonas lacunae TaxID=2698828 RepID=A0A6M4AS19_9SPHN|nr:hypothetical protein [Sphingomonas lacunae]QJQ31833.1 hypothetical protein GV829_04690 [Sphingomonas lacunae]